MTNTTNNQSGASVQTSEGKAASPNTKRRMAREPKPEEAPGAPAANSQEQPAAAAPRATTKAATVLALLQRTEGATLAEMVEATGWLPHTTRAALTGLKKKGHVIMKDKRGEVTCYHIAKTS